MNGSGAVAGMPMSSVYPGMGQSLGMLGSATNPMGTQQNNQPASSVATGAPTGAAPSGPVAQALATGMAGQPVGWWFGMVLALIAIGWSARHFGPPENFKNIGISAYNVVFIAIAALVGISLLKVAVTYIPVPGLTTLVHAV